MELKEAIEILKNLQDWYKEGNMSTTIESSELEALCVVLQALENSISKDKIKEKIEEIKCKLTSKDFTHDMYIGTDKHIVWEHLCAKKDVLEELLKGEWVREKIS